MADRYLLENGADFYLLEDATGVLLLEPPPYGGGGAFSRILTHKPPKWATISQGLVAPEWQWAWRGLVGGWMFNEGGGTLTSDLTRTNLGTLVGAPTWTRNKYGIGLTLGGTNDYVDCGSNSQLNITGNHLTICVLANFHLTTDGDLYCRGLYNNDGYRLASGSAGGIEFDVHTAAGWQYQSLWGGTVTAGWHWLVAVLNGTSMKIYLDGKEPSSYAHAGTGANIITSARNAYIGQYDDGTHRFDGELSMVLVHNRSLTLSEVQKLMWSPFAPFRMVEEEELYVAAVAAVLPFFPRSHGYIIS